jgi:hypothetical protein
VLATVAAAVGLLVGITSLTDWLGRTLHDPEPPPPPQIDARIRSVETRGTRETLEDYLRETGQSLRGVPALDRRELGLSFAVRVRLRGAIGKEFPLRWSLYDADRGRRLKHAIYNQEAAVFTPASRDHARTWPVWVPYPLREGRFFLRATLTDAEGRPVDERDSASVQVARVPQLR